MAASMGENRGGQVITAFHIKPYRRTGFSVLMPKLLLQCGKVLKRIGGKDESFVFNKFLLK